MYHLFNGQQSQCPVHDLLLATRYCQCLEVSLGPWTLRKLISFSYFFLTSGSAILNFLWQSRGDNIVSSVPLFHNQIYLTKPCSRLRLVDGSVIYVLVSYLLPMPFPSCTSSMLQLSLMRSCILVVEAVMGATYLMSRY